MEAVFRIRIIIVNLTQIILSARDLSLPTLRLTLSCLSIVKCVPYSSLRGACMQIFAFDPPFSDSHWILVRITLDRNQRKMNAGSKHRCGPV
jgi:hypothetical protein